MERQTLDSNNLQTQSHVSLENRGYQEHEDARLQITRKDKFWHWAANNLLQLTIKHDISQSR